LARSAAGKAAQQVEDSMFADIVELLQCFGIPFIRAPMEAEAQCAELERLGLAEGVVTNDSDAFLFGSRYVYRNIFDQGKYVEEYRMPDVERDLGLSREHLQRIALFLGSDYTDGLRGIGIVTAVEILRAFPGDAGLRKFREWVIGVDDAATDVAALSQSRVKDRQDLSAEKRFMLTH